MYLQIQINNKAWIHIVKSGYCTPRHPKHSFLKNLPLNIQHTAKNIIKTYLSSPWNHLPFVYWMNLIAFTSPTARQAPAHCIVLFCNEQTKVTRRHDNLIDVIIAGRHSITSICIYGNSTDPSYFGILFHCWPFINFTNHRFKINK
jgi:hypothetical protein